MSDGGKGSKPRPLSVDSETFDDNWDRIFKPSLWRKRSIENNEYQDILSTEDCVLDALDKIDKEKDQ